MRIKIVEPFILHVPVTGNQIADSTHRITHWGVVGVKLHTENGRVGYGFTGTHAHLPTDRLITECIKHTFGPLLIGENAADHGKLWQKLYHFPPLQWVGRAGISQLALAAIDIALWDLKAKAADVPLWQLLGGTSKTMLEAYNTDGGWLSLSKAQVVENCRRFVEQDGFFGVKIKVGSKDPDTDLDRVDAVRAALGPRIKLAVDANGAWDLPTAIRVGRRLAEYDVLWIEEPLWYDDPLGHAQLARAITTPIALGEQLYSSDAFRDFVHQQAVHFVQPDVTRLAGVTEWLRVADLAHSYRLPVVAHAGDMGQVHVHTAYAHPSCTLLEYIPWIRVAFAEPATVKDGSFVLPQQPGAGTTLRQNAWEKFQQSVS